MHDVAPFLPRGTQDPPNDSPDYRSTALRHPFRRPVPLPSTLSEVTGPLFGDEAVGELDHDLTRQHEGAPLGERMILTGRLTDENERPIPNSLIELWQCNASGRYHHPGDQHDAPLDPNFTGSGRAVTDADGRYRFITIKPGAYPWRNHPNAWRPAHIHLSLFGPAIGTRLITQFYFPGDPLLAHDPIFNSVPDAAARERLICRFDLDVTEPEWALGYVFNIVLRGRAATPMEHDP